MAHLLETAFRVTIDFSVTITDDETMPAGDGVAGSLERERRLLLALLKHDRDLLTEFLKKYVLIEMAALDMNELEIRMLGRRVNEQALLAPVIESMSAADAGFFTHALIRGAYAVETEHFSECIKVHLKEVALTERRLADGFPQSLKERQNVKSNTPLKPYG
jgi:hypothetical protein